MKGLGSTLIAAVTVGLVAAPVGVAAADDPVPDGAEEILAGVNPKWVADHPDPNSLDLEEGVNVYTLYEHPERPGMDILPDEAWCAWVSSYLNDDDGHATAEGIQACLDDIVVGDGDRWPVVPATFAEAILRPERIYQSPADGPVVRRGEDEEESGVFLLQGYVDYRVDIEAPDGCGDFRVWLRPKAEPQRERRSVHDGDVVWYDHLLLADWDISTACAGRWTITVEEDAE